MSYPEKIKLDPVRCSGKVYSGLFSHQCACNGTLEHDGALYCKTHHPPTVKEKRAVRQQKWIEKSDAKHKAQAKEIADQAALKADAERYRWLRSRVENYDGHACFPDIPYPAPVPDTSPFNAIDEAIDAARSKT